MGLTLEVIEPGFLTSVQDMGRLGFQHLGFSVGGAVDARSLAFANYLVGNPRGCAVLELTVRGPQVRFRARAVVAVVGAGPVVLANGVVVPANRTLALEPGCEVAIPSMRGARSYLAVAGGLAVPEALGSRSTDLVAGIGGVEGRPLKAGDVLAIGEPPSAVGVRKLRPAFEPLASERIQVQFGAGPQHDRLARERIQFVGEVFEVSSESDRMGIRLAGRAISGERQQVLSEGQPAGAIQLPAGGLPIVLLAGRQTVGGYPKLGVVAPRGLADLGQALPGVQVSFEFVDLPELESATRRWLQTVATPSLVTEPCA